jgi:glycerate kinase
VTPLRVLVAPDSFKGTLTSVEVARALAAGWRRMRPGDAVALVPLADGGEGTLAAIEAAGVAAGDVGDGWRRRTASVGDPLGRPIAADWLVTASGGGGGRAVIEMAAASGLSLIRPGQRDAMRATSRGTGELVRAALDDGLRTVVLGIGGSATTDGGRGLLEALGLAVTEVRGRAIGIDTGRLDTRLAELDLVVASDVTNPLLGSSGAAAVYGPQKGASARDVERLDARNAAWADALEAATGRRERDSPGAGAAGGVGFALLCLRDRLASLVFRPGVEVVMELAGFEERLASADLVITGEGRIDAQTAFGKTAAGVARRARAAGLRCIAVGGGVTAEGAAAMAGLGATAVPVWQSPVPLEVALAAGAAPIEACATRLALAEAD